MSYIRTYRNLPNYFIFVHLLLIEGYEHDAPRKDLIFAPFVEQFYKATLRNSYWWIPPNYAKLSKHFIFAHLLLIEGYGKCALQKEPVIAPFLEWFKTATLRKSYW